MSYAGLKDVHHRIYQAVSVQVAGEIMPQVKVVAIQGEPVPERAIVRLDVPTLRYANPDLRALALEESLIAWLTLSLTPIGNGDVAVRREPVDAMIILPGLGGMPVIHLEKQSWDIVNPHILACSVCLTDTWSPVLSVGAHLIPSLINLLTLQPGTYSLDPRTHMNRAAGRWLAEEAARSSLALPLAPPVSGAPVAEELARVWSRFLGKAQS